MNEEKVRPLGQLWSLSLFAYTVIQKHLMLAEAQDGVSYLQLASLQQIDSQINEGQIPCWLCNVDMGFGFSGEGQYNEAFFITRSVQEGSGQFVKKRSIVLYFGFIIFVSPQSNPCYFVRLEEFTVSTITITHFQFQFFTFIVLPSRAI